MWRQCVGRVAQHFSTPIQSVLDMDWIEILSFMCDAVNEEREEKLFQLKLAGAKFK